MARTKNTSARTLATARTLNNRYASMYRNMVLNDGPLAFWRFNEASGNAIDSTGNARTGTPAGGITYSQSGPIKGDTSTGVLLNGTSGRYGVTAKAGLTAPFSMECWVYHTAAWSASHEFILDWSGGSNNYFSITNGLVRLSSILNGAQRIADGVTPLSLNAWHHVVVVWDSANMICYLDNIADKTQVQAGPLTDGGTTWFIGVHSSGTLWYNGALQDLAVYPYALSSAQVSRHYNLGKNGLITARTLAV